MQRFVHRLSRLLMVLAVIGLAFGQAGARLHAAPFVPPAHDHAASQHVGHHAHEHRGHEHPAPGQHDHSDRACITACCIVPSSWTQPAAASDCVHFASAVVYGEPRQPGSGRSEAPEPGIPKHRA